MRWVQAPNKVQSRSSFKNVGSKLKAHLNYVGNTFWKDVNFTCTLERFRKLLATQFKLARHLRGMVFSLRIPYFSIFKFSYSGMTVGSKNICESYLGFEILKEDSLMVYTREK